MTLTPDEWAALLAILQRAPVTPAELLWLNTLINQGDRVVAAPPSPDPAPPPANRGT